MFGSTASTIQGKESSGYKFPDEIVSRLPIRIDNPLLSPEIYFLVTTQCNIECTYCYNFHREKHMHMSSELAISFLKSYLSIQSNNKPPLYQIVFSGGEPTINQNTIFAVMEYLNQNEIECVPTLLTNGILSPRLLQKFIDEKFLFQISYDGGDSAHRKSIGGKDISTNTLNAIEKIAHNGLPIVLRSTITQHNVRNMTDVVSFAKQYGIQSIIFDTCDNLGNALKNQIARANKDEYVHHYFEALEFAKQNQIDVIMPEIIRFKINGAYQQLPKIVLLPDGTITTTTKYLARTAKGADKGIIGHYSIENGLCLDHQKINTMVNNYLENIENHCAGCESYIFCRGRNQNAQLFREEITEQKDEYRCEITRAIYKRLQSNPPTWL